MIVVIIAGGSGTRLWPLSTPDFPKHLLKVNGDQKSILQNTYARAKKLTDKIYVVSEISHSKHVKEQLPELDDSRFLVEPARRGTANCILTALVKLGEKEDVNESIAFIHADHFIRDVKGFVQSFNIATKAATNNGKIVLVGVEPTYPATGFGYIQKDGLLDDNSLVYCVDSFKEKPDFDTAQKYQKSGNYLWNCGYFVGSINTFKTKMAEFAPKLFENYQRLVGASRGDLFDEIYLGLENEAIDYALIEKVQDLLVVPASFDWMDLGSYSDLASAVNSNKEGNYLKGTVEIDDVSNCYIENQETKPVAVIGLDNCVVINTKDGILVARKGMSQSVGDIAKKIALKKDNVE
jgi:mannose-1-phosphate guanylyltransferase